jgi:hypothetical protein
MDSPVEVKSPRAWLGEWMYNAGPGGIHVYRYSGPNSSEHDDGLVSAAALV